MPGWISRVVWHHFLVTVWLRWTGCPCTNTAWKQKQRKSSPHSLDEVTLWRLQKQCSYLDPWNHWQTSSERQLYFSSCLANYPLKGSRKKDVWAAGRGPRTDVSKPLNNEKYSKLQYRRALKWAFESLREHSSDCQSRSCRGFYTNSSFTSTVDAEMVAKIRWEAVLQRVEVETGPRWSSVHYSHFVCCMIHRALVLFLRRAMGVPYKTSMTALSLSRCCRICCHASDTGRWDVTSTRTRV